MKKIKNRKILSEVIINYPKIFVLDYITFAKMFIYFTIKKKIRHIFFMAI